jgi:membrane protein YqaA with SNARE-associated domain
VWRPPGYRRLRRIKLNRHWRAFLIALAACAVLGALAVLFAPELAGVFLLAIYCIPANSVLPVPHEPAVLYFAKFYHPVWVALAATAGTIVVSFADYALIEAAMRHPRISGAREKGLFKWAVKWMMRYPFWIIVLFSLTPLPIYVVRVLAPASGYPVARYVAAQIVGRFPRFLALAWLGHALMIPGWVLLAMFVLLLGFMWLASRNTSNAGLDDEEEEAPDAEELEIPDLSDPEHPAPAQ